MTAEFANALVPGSFVTASSMLEDVSPVASDQYSVGRNGPASITLLPTDPAPWLQCIYDEVRAGAGATGFVTQESWSHFEGFLRVTPFWVERPEVSVGEGGEITLEWQGSDGEELYITFSQVGDSAYWVDSSGDREWSGHASDQRVVRALIHISS